ncbi:hypothetical protein [Shewanella sp. 10N.286.48.B5]|uniref:hypothetical protein n=1 Tax=Shewanella sp. 10N.286.48.B5 TaxID=1880834 RepID=UPI0039A6BF58
MSKGQILLACVLLVFTSGCQLRYVAATDNGPGYSDSPIGESCIAISYKNGAGGGGWGSLDK